MSPPEDGKGYYEDYEGHYSVDLMFIIEAHKIGVVDDNELEMISINKKQMGLSENGWPLLMKKESGGNNNLKAAVYFDYFIFALNDSEYRGIIYPILCEELKDQCDNNTFASYSTGINGTCLRLLVSAYVAENRKK